jgi:hypothetical protein
LGSDCRRRLTVGDEFGVIVASAEQQTTKGIRMAGYESPTVTELGSVADFTQGQGIRGDADSIHFQFFGHDITISWGHS